MHFTQKKQRHIIRNIPYSATESVEYFGILHTTILLFLQLITDDLINAMNGNAFINVVNNPRELYNHDLLLNRAEKEEISYCSKPNNTCCFIFYFSR